MKAYVDGDRKHCQHNVSNIISMCASGYPSIRYWWRWSDRILFHSLPKKNAIPFHYNPLIRRFVWACHKANDKKKPCTNLRWLEKQINKSLHKSIFFCLFRWCVLMQGICVDSVYFVFHFFSLPNNKHLIAIEMISKGGVDIFNRAILPWVWVVVVVVCAPPCQYIRQHDLFVIHFNDILIEVQFQ